MSSKAVYRLYVDFEREERWLNQQAARGWHLVRYNLGSYHFEQGQPGAWIYRIELLPGGPHSAASREYLALLQESGVEVVTTHARWVYLRRRAALGAFELFSDLESRIGHYRRVLGFFSFLLAAMACSVASLIVVSGDSGGLAFEIPLLIVVVFMAALAVQTVRLSRRVRALRSQRQIYE